MVSGISSNVNSLQLLRAANAFKTVNKVNKPAQQDEFTEINDVVEIASSDKDFSLQTSSTNKLQMVDEQKLEEIKNIANMIQNTNLTDEDIKYGLTFGRSVLVDFSA